MTTTRFICTIVIIILGSYDFIVTNYFGINSSISRCIQDTGMNSPIFTFMMGFLASHFFGYMKPDIFMLMFTINELNAIDRIASKQELTREQVVKMALRIYESQVFPIEQLNMVNDSLKKGE